MAPHISVSDIIAFAALSLSLYSTKKTIDFNKRQKEFIETQDKLNLVLLEKERQESIGHRQADISANLVNIGRSYRVKVFNRGKATARNVRIEFSANDGVLIPGDVDSKFPLQTLEPFQAVELLATIHMGSPSKMDLTFTWNDASGDDRKKIVTVTN